MTDSPDWTIVTWNIHGRERPRISALASSLKPYAADVIVLQEVRWCQAHRLGRSLRMKVLWNLKHYPFGRLLFPLAEGAAILTPHTRVDAGVREISDPFPTTTYRRRIAQWATIARRDEDGGQVLTVVNVHLSPEQLRDDRREEARRLAAMIEQWPDVPPTLIAGDLNDHAEPEIIELLPAVERERPAPTNPADAPYQCLDHVLIPDSARHVSTEVPTGGSKWAALSDHLPVIVRFALLGNEAATPPPPPVTFS